MALLVLRQTLGGDKALPTLLTLVGFIVIDLLMILQVTDTCKAFATMAALEKTVLDMSKQMLL